MCKFCPLRRVYYKIDVQSCLTLFVFTMSRCRLTFYPGKGEVIWDVNIKFGYSEKATKFEKIFDLRFDPTRWRQILSGRFFQILWPSQNIQTLKNVKKVPSWIHLLRRPALPSQGVQPLSFSTSILVVEFQDRCHEKGTKINLD